MRRDPKLLGEFPEGESCVAMVVYQNRVYVATQRQVYAIYDGKLLPVLFQTEGSANVDA